MRFVARSAASTLERCRFARCGAEAMNRDECLLLAGMSRYGTSTLIITLRAAINAARTDWMPSEGCEGLSVDLTRALRAPPPRPSPAGGGRSRR